MKKVFVDTNVLIDLLADRRPFSKNAIEIFNKAELLQIELFMSANSYATTHYILKKYLQENELREILITLLDYLKIISVDQNIIQRSLKSKHKDFEDSIQMHSAYSISDMFCIITRNIKDFKDSEIAVYTPEEFLNKI